MPRSRPLIVLLTALFLVVAACGDDDGPDTAETPVDEGATGSGASGEDDVVEADDEDEDESPSGAAPPSVPPETAPDAEAEVPPAESGGEHDGMGDPIVFVADLIGGAVVPGPGHPEATGRLEIESDVDGNLCFDLRVQGLSSDVIHADIHEEAAGERADPVFAIGPPSSVDGDTDVWSDVCEDVDEALVERITHDPAGFSADVHTVDLGSGAIRGQLQLATIFDLTLS